MLYILFEWRELFCGKEVVFVINEKYKSEYQERFAFIIGIDKYLNVGALEHAEADAKSIRETLVNVLGYKKENIVILLGEEATKENILKHYSNYINDTCDNDSLLFYYAGHGETYMGIQGNEGFLVPYDGTQENWNTLIGWKEIIEKGNLIKAKHIFYVIDACYSGLALCRGPAFASSRFLSDLLSRPARQVLTAGKGDQKVTDAKGPIANHSLFTGYFLKGLQGEAAQDNGIITANMLMAYVTNKVWNDSRSFQTPQSGEVFGDGDFVFKGMSEQPSENNDKNEECLIRIPSPNDDYVDITNSRINKFKEQLSDSKNRIRINELLNQELKEVSSKLMLVSKFPNVYKDEAFKETIEKYNQIINHLLQMLILLIYYGDGQYNTLLQKVVDKLANIKNTIGIGTYIDVQYYPCLIAYYISIITCIESNNLTLLKELLSMNKERGANRHFDTNNLLVGISTNISMVSNHFKMFSPEERYKYPFSEYVYVLIQPILDDLLYLSDEYEQDFLDAEVLISVMNALERYKYDFDERLWWPQGRYNYKMSTFSPNLEKMTVFNLIEKLGFLNDLEDKKDIFIRAYNSFLSKSIF